MADKHTPGPGTDERLRDAAPDLLEALQKLVEVDDAASSQEHNYAEIERARAAIAKATGDDQ